jgi:ABC-2 type transport system permease protein
VTTQTRPAPGLDELPPDPGTETRPHAELESPFSTGGLVDVFKKRYLLKLLVRKEVRSRYQGSVLGFMWSYINPLVRFCMYFFVIGLVLGLHKNLPNFAIHMFCAIVGVHYFTETFSSGTRSIVKNKAIVRKMAMPREMFPVSAVIVSAINSLPQLLILFVGAVAVGWRPDPEGLLAAVLGIAILTVLGTALALLFAGFNVFFRDFQSVVSVFTVFTHWIVPMIYPFYKLSESGLGSNNTFYTLYLSNPLTVAVLLLQRAFWIPTTVGKKGFPDDVSQIGFPYMPHQLVLLGVTMLVVSGILLVLCQMVFRRLEGKFAERL